MRKVDGVYLKSIDNYIHSFLINHQDWIPKRWKKVIALYYPDARVRKEYLKYLYVFMGEGTYANLGLKTDATEDAPVVIGDHVSIAPNVVLITESSPNNAVELSEIESVKNRYIKKDAIYIEDEVWIGANVTVLPGVRIHKGAIIGACSLVKDDVDGMSVYAGVPAKKIRDL